MTVYLFKFFFFKNVQILYPSHLQGLVPSNWSNEKFFCLNNLLKSTSHTSSTVNVTNITFGVRVFTFSHEVISITVFQHYIQHTSLCILQGLLWLGFLGICWRLFLILEMKRICRFLLDNCGQLGFCVGITVCSFFCLRNKRINSYSHLIKLIIDNISSVL